MKSFSIFCFFFLHFLKFFDFNCFDLSNVHFFLPLSSKTTKYYHESFIWSYRMFVNNPTTSLLIVLDNEERNNIKFLKDLNHSLININHSLTFANNPAFSLASKDRSQWYNLWADNFTNSEYVAFADTDTLFTAKVHYFDFFINEKPRVSGFFADMKPFWKNFYETTEQLIGKVTPLQTMSYFPVILKTQHLALIRNHVTSKMKSFYFDHALEIIAKSNLNTATSSPYSFSQFQIMTSFLWYYLRSEYFWDIVPFMTFDEIKNSTNSYAKRMMTESGISEKDLTNYFPRVAMHSKYEHILPLHEIKIQSVCYAIKNDEVLFSKYPACFRYRNNPLNVLQWCFETGNGPKHHFFTLRDVIQKQMSRDKLSEKCIKHVNWDKALVHSTLFNKGPNNFT